MTTIMQELKRHRDAIIIGGLVGLGTAYYLIQQGIDLTTIANAGKGLYDTVLGREANLMEAAKTKLYIVMTLLGATSGYVISYVGHSTGILKLKQRGRSAEFMRSIRRKRKR